jgi:hypothetical protein
MLLKGQIRTQILLKNKNKQQAKKLFQISIKKNPFKKGTLICSRLCLEINLN